MKNCELLWYTYFFSLFLLHLLLHTIQNAFSFFSNFQRCKGVVWKKSKYCNAKYLLWTTNKKKCEQKNFFRIIIISILQYYFFCLMPLRAIERKHFHFSLFFFYFFCPQSFSFYKKLFRNKRFVINKMFLQKASKLADFYV